MDPVILFALGSSVVAIIYAVFLTTRILKASPGNARMQEISNAVKEGANAYLNRQYKTIAGIAAVLFVIIGFAINWTTALGFLVGAFLSALAGYVGMFVSVRANARTAEAARGGLAPALALAATAPLPADYGPHFAGIPALTEYYHDPQIAPPPSDADADADADADPEVPW